MAFTLPKGEWDAATAEDALAIAEDHAEELIEAARLFAEELERESPLFHGVASFVAGFRDLISDHLFPLKQYAESLREIEGPGRNPNTEHRLSASQLGVDGPSTSPIFNQILNNFTHNFGARP